MVQTTVFIDVEVEETVVYQATDEAEETVTIEHVRGTSQHNTGQTNDT